MTRRRHAHATVRLFGLVALCAFCIVPALAETTDKTTDAASAGDWPEQNAELLQVFQGSWQAYGYGTDDTSWKLVIEGNRFRGEQGPDNWYSGTIRARDDRNPGWIDIQITDSDAYHKGKTTRAIFRVTGATILLAAPPPGEARAKEIKKKDGGISVELKRVPPAP